MKTCPKCGAENRQTASECRLCATPLESPGDLLEVRLDLRHDAAFPGELPPDRLVSGPEPSGQHAPASSYAGHSTCPRCGTVNEPDWVFCQQCGTQLRGKPPGSGASVQGSAGQLIPSSLGAPFVAGPKVEPRAPATKPETRNEVAPAPGQPNLEVTASGGIAASGPKTARTCPTCGVLVPPGLMYCANCGRTVSTEHEARGPVAAAPLGSAAPADVPANIPLDVPVGVPVPQPQPEMAVIQMITEGGQVGDVYEIAAGELKIGRVEGDIKFPHDGYLSSLHARVIERDGRYFLVDEHSRNGTFIRIRDEVELKPGDTFLVGKQVFKFTTEKGA